MDIRSDDVEDQTGALRAFISEDVLSNQTSAFLDDRAYGEVDLDKDDLSFDRDNLWDPNVLLSNAGTCELNPLLEVDNGVHDDYDRLFSEWDNNSFAQSSAELQFCDDGLGMKNQELFFDDLERPLQNTPVTTTAKIIKEEPDTEEVDPVPLITSAANGKLTLGKRSVAGIVISSGPGAHFATFEVIEEQDVDRLLDELDSFSNLMDDNEMLNKATHLRDLDEATLIVEAVQNHFSQRDKGVGLREIKNPKIVPSQKIKDALPKEIIESIRASSVHSRTIAIVEPINRKLESDKKSVSSFVKPEPSLGKPFGLTTRFQEAAVNLSRTNKVRQILMPTSLTSGNQSPVILDHDYCTSGSRVIKRSSVSSSSISVTKTKQSLAKEKKIQKASNLSQTSSSFSSSSQSSEPRSIFQVVSSRPSISAIGQFRNRLAPAQIRLEKSRSSSKTFTKMTAPTITVAQSTCSYSDLSNSMFGAPDSPLTYDLSSDSIKAEITDYDYDASADFFSVTHDLAKTPFKSFDAKTNGDLHSAPFNMADDDNHVENDTKKDSGLESGEVSDSSESDPNAPGRRVYTKAPSFHSSLRKSSRKSSEANNGRYDRLQAYMKEIPSRLQLTSNLNSGSLPTSASTLVLPTKSPERLSRSRSPLKKPTLSPVRHSARLRRQRSFSSASTSSSSSCDITIRSSSRSRKRSFQKRFLRHRSNSHSKSPPPSSGETKHRTRMLVTQPAQQTRREVKRKVHQLGNEVEERRIVYVGKITEGTTRADLRKRFEKFGPILEISLHFRDRGDNYGFVTFKYKSHAIEAIEHGNDDPNFEKVNLCFGGRRNFCKERYTDLDYSSKSTMESFSTNHFDVLLRQARDGLSPN